MSNEQEIKDATDRKKRFNLGIESSQDIYGRSTVSGINRCMTKDDEILAAAYLATLAAPQVPEVLKEMRSKQYEFRHDGNFVLVYIPHEGKLYQSTSFMIDVNTQLYRVKADTEIAKYLATMLNAIG